MSSGRNRYSSAPMFTNGKNSPLIKNNNADRNVQVYEEPPEKPNERAGVSGDGKMQDAQVYNTRLQPTYQYREPAYSQARTNMQQNSFMQQSPAQNTGALPEEQHNAKTSGQERLTWLQAALTVGLPLVFVLAMVMRETYLIGAAFILCTVILIALMWIMKAFAPNARKTLTMIYAALVIVTGVSIYMIIGNFDAADVHSDTPVSSSNISVQPTATIYVPSPTDEPAAHMIAASGNAAKQQLETFISYWMLTQYRNCLEFCRPEWVTNQQNAETSLFHKLGDIMPISYTIESIDGSEADTSRTVKLLMLGTNLQNQEVYYRYTILMLKSNNIWYVDPDSLNGIVVTTQELVESGISVKTPAPTDTPKPTVNPQMTLYYNPDGGKFYHVSKKCSSMDSQNQKKLQPFYYANLNNEPFKNLSPCPKCGAPARQ